MRYKITRVSAVPTSMLRVFVASNLITMLRVKPNPKKEEDLN